MGCLRNRASLGVVSAGCLRGTSLNHPLDGAAAARRATCKKLLLSVTSGKTAKGGSFGWFGSWWEFWGTGSSVFFLEGAPSHGASPESSGLVRRTSSPRPRGRVPGRPGKNRPRSGLVPGPSPGVRAQVEVEVQVPRVSGRVLVEVEVPRAVSGPVPAVSGRVPPESSASRPCPRAASKGAGRQGGNTIQTAKPKSRNGPQDPHPTAGAPQRRRRGP